MTKSERKEYEELVDYFLVIGNKAEEIDRQHTRRRRLNELGKKSVESRKKK